MVILARLTKFASRCQNGNHLYSISRCSATKAPWPYLWQPGPRPKTEEERLAAAEKYGIHPSEYEPYDPQRDGICLGDYPKVRTVSADARDPFEAWDYPDSRRNYNEAIHFDENIIGLDRYDYYGVKQRYSFLNMLGTFLAVVGTFVGLTIYFNDKPYFRPALEKQLPKPGVVHYTFEATN